MANEDKRLNLYGLLAPALTSFSLSTKADQIKNEKGARASCDWLLSFVKGNPRACDSMG